MQGSSKFVKEDDICKAGDLVKSTTGEVCGSVREKDYRPVKFLPIYMYKTWVKSMSVKDSGGKEKWEYIETYPVTPLNTDQRWLQEEKDADGKVQKYKLTKNINFYVLLEKDFGNLLAVPYVLTYRSTSARAAAIVEDWFAQCKAAKAAKMQKNAQGQLMLPFAKLFELGGKMDKKDDDAYFILQTKELTEANQELVSQAYNWYKVVSKSQHDKVDNSDLQDTSTVSKETEF